MAVQGISCETADNRMRECGRDDDDDGGDCKQRAHGPKRARRSSVGGVSSGRISGRGTTLFLSTAVVVLWLILPPRPAPPPSSSENLVDSREARQCQGQVTHA
jgi:hypothetical protein